MTRGASQAVDATLSPPRALPDHRTLRLAELVQHLTGCAPRGALRALETTLDLTDGDDEDALATVARAIVTLRHIDLREPRD